MEEQPRVPRGRQRFQLVLRLILILLLLGLGGYLIYRGGWPALLFWLLLIVFLIEHSVGILFALYDEPRSRWYGFLFWVASAFLGSLAVQMVRQKGLEVKTVRPAGPLAPLFARLGAPAIVVIENGLAVVFERSGKYTRVHGPGIVYTRRFERVAHVIDLRPQLRRAVIEGVQTRDGLKFDIKPLYVLFQVATAYPQQADYGYSEQAVLDLVYRGGLLYDEKGEPVEWGRRVLGMVEYHLRRVASRYDLLDLVRGDRARNARQSFLQEVTAAARPDLLQRGVNLIGVDMGAVSVPGEVQELLMLPVRHEVDIGWAHTQRDAVVGISEGLAQAIAQIEASIPVDATQTRPHLLLNLVSTLGTVLERFLQLVQPYHEARKELPGPSGRVEEERAMGRAGMSGPSSGPFPRESGPTEP
ncbi:MAG: SPFH domain-containing protein [Chloroflexia bacterium]